MPPTYAKKGNGQRFYTNYIHNSIHLHTQVVIFIKVYFSTANKIISCNTRQFTNRDGVTTFLIQPLSAQETCIQLHVFLYDQYILVQDCI